MYILHIELCNKSHKYFVTLIMAYYIYHDWVQKKIYIILINIKIKIICIS